MKTDSDHLFSKEGYDLMAAAFEVHNETGGGLLEEIYQESLEFELSMRGIPFKAKQELAVFYKGRELKKRYIPDLYVFDGIVAELKAVSALLGAAHQLHEAGEEAGGLPHQLRAHQRRGVEAVCRVNHDEAPLTCTDLH